MRLVLLLLTVISVAHGIQVLFNSQNITNAPDVPEEYHSLTSLNKNWNLLVRLSAYFCHLIRSQITNDSWLQVTKGSSMWYWRVNATDGTVNRTLFVQVDGNVALYGTKNSSVGFWSTNTQEGGYFEKGNQYNLTINNQGQVIHYNMNTSQIKWNSSIIKTTRPLNITSTDGGQLFIGGSFNLQEEIPTASLEDRPIIVTGHHSNQINVTIPPGTGLGLSLKIFIRNTIVQTLFDYPPTLSVSSSLGSITVNATSVKSGSTLRLYGSAFSLQSPEFTSFSSDLTYVFSLPTSTLSGNLTVRLSFNINTLLETTIYYRGYLQSIETLDATNTSLSHLFTTIEEAVRQVLSTSDTFTIYNAGGISVQASNILKNSSVVVGNLNGTQFSIPSTIVESLSDENDTRLSYIFSTLSNDLFPHDKEYNVTGQVVGLSLYGNGTYLSVSDTTSTIDIIIPSIDRTDVVCLFWSQMTSSWKRDGCETILGIGSVTCRCNHLTNFTLGALRREERTSFNKLYLLAIVGIIPVILIVVVLSVLVMKRREDGYHTEDVVVEREIGRGRDTIIYLGTKSGTTRIAVKKSRNDKRGVQLIKEYNLLKDIHHPHILLAFENYVEDKMTCLVVEYMECGTLEQVMKDDVTYDNEQIDSIMGQICSALIYLHDKGIVHGRICTKKIYMSTHVDIKLSVRGTDAWEDVSDDMREYLAPEIPKKRAYTTEGDVYSYGVLFDRLRRTRGEKEEDPAVWNDIVSMCTDESAVKRPNMKAVGKMLRPSVCSSPFIKASKKTVLTCRTSRIFDPSVTRQNRDTSDNMARKKTSRTKGSSASAKKTVSSVQVPSRKAVSLDENQKRATESSTPNLAQEMGPTPEDVLVQTQSEENPHKEGDQLDSEPEESQNTKGDMVKSAVTYLIHWKDNTFLGTRSNKLTDLLEEKPMYRLYRGEEASSANGNSVIIKIYHSAHQATATKEVQLYASLKERPNYNRFHVAFPIHQAACESEKRDRAFDHSCLIYKGSSILSKADLNVDISTMKNISVQLLTSLVLLRQSSIVHGNIRPWTILVQEESTDGIPNVQLMGFESATLLEESQSIVPMDNYTSPEVLLGFNAGIENDVWALGCLLAELKLGHALLPVRNTNELFSRLDSLLGPAPDIYKEGKYYDMYLDESGHPVDQDQTQVMDEGVSHPLPTLLSTPGEAHFGTFMEGVLHYNRNERFSPENALTHPFLFPMTFPGNSSAGTADDAEIVMTINQLKQEVERLTNERAHDAASAEKNREKFQRKLKELEEKKREEVEDAIREHELTTAKRTEDIERQMTRLGQQLASAEERCERIKETEEEEKRRLTEGEEKLREMETVLARKEEEMVSLRKVIEEHQAEIQQLTESTSHTKEELRESKKRVKELEKENKRLRDKRDKDSDKDREGDGMQAINELVAQAKAAAERAEAAAKALQEEKSGKGKKRGGGKEKSPKEVTSSQRGQSSKRDREEDSAEIPAKRPREGLKKTTMHHLRSLRDYFE
ncbi:hypothetical protein PROFUN_00804 [Planoprotostelium fungivorum]|uniref:Uncharacterized protein n=1 Tax=Planoprotostelium fungivorum TaxID=1890364 RepID=A0A2P6P020_9EUKA|nr:hypothetical protein PROFUN_00804 [Planoprotostelium fungivorum]